MRVDVIIPTYNRAAQLRQALDHLVRQELPGCALRVVVVDNGSTDDTRAVVAAYPAPRDVALEYVLEPAQGIAHARNRGLAKTTAPWVALFDDDQLAAPGCLRELLAVAGATGALCVAGAVTLAGSVGPERRLPPFCRRLLGEALHAAEPWRFRGKLVPAGTNVLVHRVLLAALGGFETILVGGADDCDFFRRARRAGFAMWFAPGARAAHQIPPYRLTREYLLWVASRHGAEYAMMELKDGGRWRVVRDGLLRASQTLVVTLPRLLLARVTRDRERELDARCLWARAVGYERQALRLLAPKLFTQRRFFEALKFREERARFTAVAPGRTA